MSKNVLLLIADDWSPLAGCYGNKVVQTPVVDELATRGVVFEQAFCTTPSCAASRATLLTGLHSHAHGQYGHSHKRHSFRTLPTVQTLPAILREHGITTGIIGKQHTLPVESYPWDVNQSETNPKGIDFRDPNEVKRAARAFFRASQGRPFYLHVGFWRPHRHGDGFGNDVSFERVPTVHYEPDDVVVPGFLPDYPEVRRELVDYYTAVSRLDFTIGGVLEALRDSGLEKDTLVILMSDHGMPFPGAKASSFDSGHHCPLIISDPDGTKRGVRNRALVNWTDLMPTVLEGFGISPPQGLHGRSLLPVLDSEEPPGWDETTFSHSFHGVTEYYPYRAIRGRRYKYVLNLFPELTLPLPTDLFTSKTWRVVERERLELGQRRTLEVLHQPQEKLYDVQADPQETHNLINAPELADLVADFRAKMKAFREETDDFWLLASEQEHLRHWR